MEISTPKAFSSIINNQSLATHPTSRQSKSSKITLLWLTAFQWAKLQKNNKITVISHLNFYQLVWSVLNMIYGHLELSLIKHFVENFLGISALSKVHNKWLISSLTLKLLSHNILNSPNRWNISFLVVYNWIHSEDSAGMRC